MGAIDSSIVSVALPHMMGTLGATVQEITWISTGYIIANVVVMPLTGFLGRLFGQKRVYMICLVLFLLGSVLCGTARTLPALISSAPSRGSAPGRSSPPSRPSCGRPFPPRSRAWPWRSSRWRSCSGPPLGPTLGRLHRRQLLVALDLLHQRSGGRAGSGDGAAFVHEDEDIVAKNLELAEKQRKNIDWWGIGLLVVGLCSLQYFLEEGDRNDWFQSTPITVAFGVAVTVIALFIVRELTCEVPAVNLRLFKDPVFLSGTV